MNRILTTNAADGQPFLSPTSLDMLQDAYKTGFADLVKSIIGSTYSALVPYVLWGCEVTSAPAITAGALFFNGEVITVAAWAPGVACFASVPGLNIVESYAASDPVTYESGSSYNTHQIRTAVASCGTSGTFSIGDFTDLVWLRSELEDIAVNDPVTWAATVGDEPKCVRDNGRVQLSGGFTVILGPAGANFGLLPVGFRPYKNMVFAMAKVQAATYSTIQVKISTAGVISVANTADIPSATSYIALDAITFLT
jgi:hypothetical protein